MSDPLAGFPVIVEQAVMWGEMDAYRHVNNTVYFRYFENARLELFRRLDWPAIEAATGVGPILHSTRARFRKALAYPDTVRIGARISSVAEDRFTVEHVIVSVKLGEVVTEGESTVVAFRHDRGVKAAIPEELLRRMRILGNGEPPTSVGGV